MKPLTRRDRDFTCPEHKPNTYFLAIWSPVGPTYSCADCNASYWDRELKNLAPARRK